MGLASTFAAVAFSGAALVTTASGATGPSTRPVVDLGYAKYQGNINTRGVSEFLGLRFAAPPTGNLRWRKPQDPPHVDGIQDATKFKAVCVGQSQSVVPGVTEEDCLYANVFTPADAKPDSKYPVWVFLQGGAWQEDANSNYNGTDLIVQSGLDIVHVNFNYRVAQLGFLSGTAFEGGHGDFNVGLLDQWKLLHWVRQHIHLFGGDPDQVVLHGASAGAGSMSHFLTAHGGRDDGLFAGAIGDGVSWGIGARPNDTDPNFNQFADQMGCSDAEDQMACLRALDIAKIQSFNRSTPAPGKAPWFNPVIDGEFVTGPQRDAFRGGRFVKVPLIIGDAADEGSMFAPNASDLDTVKKTVQATFARLSDEQVQQVVDAYPAPTPVASHAKYFSVISAIAGESIFICPGNAISAGASNHVARGDTTWNYRWNTTEELAVQAGLGAWHTSDLIAVFGPGHTGDDSGPLPGLGTTYNPDGANAAIVPMIQHYFISFIKTLNPNTLRHKGSPSWDNWGAGNGHRLRIQTNNTAMEAVPQAQADRCDVWSSLNNLIQQ